MTEKELEALEAKFTDYLDGAMSADDRAAFEKTLAESAEARRAFEEFRHAVEAVSGLHKMAAPQHFEDGVEQRIHKRSAGRFFGRRAFGDRVPFELIAIVALAALVGVWPWVRYGGGGGAAGPTTSPSPSPSTTTSSSTSTSTSTTTATATLTEGSIAPDFEVEDHRGNVIRLAALRGRAVVLYWYPKDETPG
jgi:hypothetical protein